MPQDRYSPDFEVRIGDAGEKIPDALRRVIASVSLTTGLEGADRVEVGVANQALEWLDKPLLEVKEPPMRFELRLGYTGAIVPMFIGGITGVAASFPSSGVPQLTITAQDARHRLQKGKEAKWHNESKPNYGHSPKDDSDIVAEVADRHGLEGSFEPPGKGLVQLVAAAAGLSPDPDASQKAVRQQVGESDYDFLRRLAKQNGLEMVIDYSEPNGGKKLRLFSPPGKQDADLELEYMLSLIEFTPRESNVGQVESVAANVWVPARKKQVGVTLTADVTRSELVVKVADAPAKPDKKDGAVLLNEPLTPATAPARLVGELMPRLNQKLTGSGSTIGDPRIRAGTVIRLTGLGVRFGGLYRVTSATHTIDTGGYKTRFEVRKELWFNVIPAAVQKAQPVRAARRTPAGLEGNAVPPIIDAEPDSVAPAGGGTPLSGVAIAEVITNRDDTNQGRVQLRLPWMPGVEPWARIASNSAGPNRGIYFIPQVGDEVLVAFQHGDVRDPYVLGVLWNATDTPPRKAPLDPVDKRVIRTPAGHEIELDDKKKSVTVKTCTGQTIFLDPDKIEVTTDGGTATVKLETSGSVSVTANVKIELKAQTISLEATQLQLKGSGAAKLDGGGMCEIKAGMVKIN